MTEQKSNPNLWAIVTLLVAIIACIGSISAAVLPEIIKMWDPTAIPRSTDIPIANPYPGKQQFPGLVGEFIGQDGGDYVGEQCSTEATNDNVHIRLSGLRSGVEVEKYIIHDVTNYGLWALPCDPLSNWLIQAISLNDGSVDLYFKPFTVAPAGTRYKVEVHYVDNTYQQVEIIGLDVKP